MSYETLIVETPSAGVTLIRLNRPEALKCTVKNSLIQRLSTFFELIKASHHHNSI